MGIVPQLSYPTLYHTYFGKSIGEGEVFYGIVKFLNDTGAKELDGDLQQFSVEYALPSYSVSLNYYEIKQEYIKLVYSRNTLN